MQKTWMANPKLKQNKKEATELANPLPWLHIYTQKKYRFGQKKRPWFVSSSYEGADGEAQETMRKLAVTT